MAVNTPVRRMEDIPGWFNLTDQMLFDFFLGIADTPDGDLVELGPYLGKSAVHIGAFRRPAETFTVCDLFGVDPDDDANASENEESYSSLDRATFEQNYRAIRHELPTIIQGPSAGILDHVAARSTRFVHVDASHLYEHVVIDIDSAEAMLKPGGIVAFDDYRSPHTPGVAAAVWGAVTSGRITPVCLSRSKLYAVFGDADPYHEQLLNWLHAKSALKWAIQRLVDRDVVVRIRR